LSRETLNRVKGDGEKPLRLGGCTKKKNVVMGEKGTAANRGKKPLPKKNQKKKLYRATLLRRDAKKKAKRKKILVPRRKTPERKRTDSVAFWTSTPIRDLQEGSGGRQAYGAMEGSFEKKKMTRRKGPRENEQ